MAMTSVPGAQHKLSFSSSFLGWLSAISAPKMPYSRQSTLLISLGLAKYLMILYLLWRIKGSGSCFNAAICSFS